MITIDKLREEKYAGKRIKVPPVVQELVMPIVMTIFLIAMILGVVEAAVTSGGRTQSTNVDVVNSQFYDHCKAIGGYAQIGDVNMCVTSKSAILDEEDNHVTRTG